MVQGVNKEYVFNTKEYIKKYLEIINENRREYDFEIIAYCIMNNHAHFLIYTRNRNDFGKFMHRVNLLYAQMYNKKENRCGVLFRNRYKTEPIYDRKYLINCIKYIHNNPVKAKMVEKCEDYEYSSYNEYINNMEITKSKILNEIFGENCDYAKLFNQSFDKKFMDIEDYNIEMRKEYIAEGIREFVFKFSYTVVDILSNREVFKKLIAFLNKECKFKYIEIREYFGISKGIMDYLK